jgi:hypothetical protein
MPRAQKNQYLYVDAQGALDKMLLLKKEYRVELAEALEELGKIGEEEAKRKIQTSGTAWSARRASLGIGGDPAGRALTGKMYRSVGHRQDGGSRTGGTIRMLVGFLKGQYEKYFGLQEVGFKNWWAYGGRGKTFGPNAPSGFRFIKRKSPKRTEGMRALREGKQKMLDEMPRVLRNAEDRINKKFSAAGGKGKF